MSMRTDTRRLAAAAATALALALAGCTDSITLVAPSGSAGSTMAATPTFSPAGGTYTADQSVTISTATSGADIYYTTDGSVPAASSTKYAGAITVGGNGTLEVILAIAVKPGLSDSGVAAGSYKISHTIVTAAGDGTSGYHDGVASSAQFATPAGIAMDASGNYYLADFGNWVVRKVTNTGSVSTIVGSNQQGSPSSPFTDGATATSVRLWGPCTVALDAAATNLYVGDALANAVYRVVLSTGKIYHFAGTVGTSGATGDDGYATAATMDVPTGLAVNGAGDVFISDYSNNVVRVVRASDSKIHAYAGSYAAGFSGDGNQSLTAQLNHPIGLALDASGSLYIADCSNGRVRKVSALGTITTVAGGPSTNAGWQDGGPATAYLQAVMAVALDSSGNLFLGTYSTALGSVVLRLGSDATLWAVAGGGSYLGLGDNGPATEAFLSMSYYYDDPSGVAIDSAGGMYITDSYHNRVRKVQ
jgi:trimeric autotransporter adhesin